MKQMLKVLLFPMIFLMISVSSSFAYISPTQDSLPLQQDVINVVDIKITTEQEVNAIEFRLRYNPEELEIIQTNYTNSIFDLVLKQEQAVDDISGILSFQGVRTSGGFSGQEGTVFRLYVIPIRTQPGLRLEQGDVFLHDGQGTPVPLMENDLSYHVVSDNSQLLDPQTLSSTNFEAKPQTQKKSLLRYWWLLLVISNIVTLILWLRPRSSQAN